MFSHWFWKPGVIVLIILLPVLLLAPACGSAAEPTAAPGAGQQAPPTPPLLRPIDRATPTTPAEMAAATPTPAPEPTPAQALASQSFGGHIPMADYAAPSKRSLYWGGSSTMKNMGPIYNTLVEWDPEDPDPTLIRGDLAARWEVLDGGQTYVFHLNENARWHDGMPVTADDVVFSLDNMICPDCFEVSKGRVTTSAIFIRGAYDAGNSRAIDDKTVEVKLNHVTPNFLDMLSLSTTSISARHTVVDQGQIQDIYKPEGLNGSGPFKFLGYTKDVKNAYEKNADYWKEGYPRIDAMTHFIITDPGTAAAAFKSKQVLMQNQPTTPFTPLQAVQLGQDMEGDLTVHWAGPSGFRGIQMMVRKKPFDDVRVRQALNLALYRQPIIDLISGGADLLGTPLPPDSWYSYTVEEAAQMPGFRELGGEKHPDDLAKARQLLEEAGYGEGFEVEFATRDAVGYPDMAAIIADQLRQFLGWDVTMKVYESAAGYVEYDAGNFQFALQGSTLNLDSPIDALNRYQKFGAPARRAVGGNASEGWVPDGVQDLIEAVGAEPDREKSKALALQAHRIMLNEDNNYIGVTWTMRHWPINNRIQNMNMHPSGYAQHKLEHMWCDPKC